MRILLSSCCLAVMLAATLPQDAAAQRRIVYPWCAFYNVMGGVTECFFHNLDQCRAAVSGVGGFCSPNPSYVEPPPVRRQRMKRRR